MKRHWLSNEGGAVVVFAGVGIAAAVGMAAFAVDLSNAYSTKGRLQNAADAAALAATQRLHISEEDARAVALELAQKNVGAIDGRVSTDADVAFGQWDAEARDFLSGLTPYNAVKVTTHRTRPAGNPVETYFGGIFGVREIDVSAEAVAVLTRWDPCVFVRSPSAPDAFATRGASHFRAPNCGIQVDSTSDRAMSVSAASSVTARAFCVAGDYQGGRITPLPDPDCELVADPLAQMPEPDVPDCHMTDVIIKTSVVLPSGVAYCGEITLSAQAHVTFEPGIVYFRDAHLHMLGAASVEGDAVMLFFDRSSTFELNGTPEIRLKAPKAGPYKGVALFQSRLGSASRPGILQGNSTLHVSGSIYAPRLDLKLGGFSHLHAVFQTGHVVTNRFESGGASSATIDMLAGIGPAALVR